MNADDLTRLHNAFDTEVAAAGEAQAVEALRIKYLGRKGELRHLLDGLKSADPADRPTLGKLINELKQHISKGIEAQAKTAGKAPKSAAPSTGAKVDPTLPGLPYQVGGRHVIIKTLRRMIDIFVGLGFDVAEGPEVEEEYYNFDALNIPADHPARDPHDNFYVTDDLLLRSQTSPMQIRVMEKAKPPLRYIVPGRVYRPDTVDASHSFMFHQLEGFAVDRDITFIDLKNVLNIFVHEFYGKDAVTRFRPHFFPFTEPSAELDMGCGICAGKGCAACSGKGWLEICGCGMIDPNVLNACGIDPEEYSGWAFGFGIERPAMMKYGITDIRLFFENDVRFLTQFV
ncbi:MAG: phenylalanine--tRNA ligase subunit alpha [Candidatus Abyssubacteria bacterium]|nr:phenylalanine--tRNA ligase subunit alpha [Candidatus Abyssubacteria bacterium]